MRARQRAFTLLEILVALSVLAIGLAAASRGSLISTGTADSLQARQLAGWVAENRVAWLRASRAWPEPGASSGQQTLAGRQFIWRQQVSPAAQGHFRRLEIAVVDATREDENLARLVSYLERP